MISLFNVASPSILIIIVLSWLIISTLMLKWGVQKGCSFLYSVKSMEQVMSKWLNIKTATAYWIEPVEKTALKLVFTDTTQAKTQSCNQQVNQNVN